MSVYVSQCVSLYLSVCLCLSVHVCMCLSVRVFVCVCVAAHTRAHLQILTTGRGGNGGGEGGGGQGWGGPRCAWAEMRVWAATTKASGEVPQGLQQEGLGQT